MAENRNVEIQADIDRLKNDLSKLKEDFGDVFATAMDLGRDTAGSAKDKLAAGVAELKKAAGKAKEKGGVAVEAVEHKIQEHPFTSVLIAFGVGVLVAKLLDRR